MKKIFALGLVSAAVLGCAVGHAMEPSLQNIQKEVRKVKKE